VERHRRTQGERRDAARTAILETAVQLLAGGGYASMTLADLGQRAGYSRSLATHYFGSKSKLLAEVIDYVLTESPPRALADDAPGTERIEAEVEGFFANLRTHPWWLRAYIVIAHEAATSLPELQPAIHRQNVAFRGRIEAALREAIDLGSVDPELDVVSASLAIMAMVRGVAWEWFTDPSLDVDACERALLTQVRTLSKPRTKRRA
jgi:AcrR family transcriptional regulator